MNFPRIVSTIMVRGGAIVVTVALVVVTLAASAAAASPTCQTFKPPPTRTW